MLRPPRRPRRLGALAEGLAVLWLRLRGHRILARNLRLGADEIDVVTSRRGVIHFVEVRYREAGIGAAVRSIDARKARALGRAARRWLRRSGRAGRPARIDLIAVSRRGWRVELRRLREVVPLHPR